MKVLMHITKEDVIKEIGTWDVLDQQELAEKYLYLIDNRDLLAELKLRMDTGEITKEEWGDYILEGII